MGVFTSTPKTWAAEALRSSDLNAQIRDFVLAFGAGQSYTPSWTGASSNPTIGNGTIVGAYTQIGKMVYFRIAITAGSTTTFGTGQYSLTLPVAPVAAAGRVVFTGWLAAGSAYPIYGIANSSTTLNLYYMATLPSLANFTGAAPVSLASGHAITIHGMYEAA
jgi:hypothetical protein